MNFSVDSVFSPDCRFMKEFWNKHVGSSLFSAGRILLLLPLIVHSRKWQTVCWAGRKNIQFVFSALSNHLQGVFPPSTSTPLYRRDSHLENIPPSVSARSASVPPPTPRLFGERCIHHRIHPACCWFLHRSPLLILQVVCHYSIFFFCHSAFKVSPLKSSLFLLALRAAAVAAAVVSLHGQKSTVRSVEVCQPLRRTKEVRK